MDEEYDSIVMEQHTQKINNTRIDQKVLENQELVQKTLNP